jgi:hypothetical protein
MCRYGRELESADAGNDMLRVCRLRGQAPLRCPRNGRRVRYAERLSRQETRMRLRATHA